MEPGADVALVSGSDGLERTPDGRSSTTTSSGGIARPGRHRVGWHGHDEAHDIKNDSARTKHVLRLAGLGDGAREPEVVYLLTGTPMTNRPRDLFNVRKAVRHRLTTSFYS